MSILLIIGLCVGFYMAWGIGANDVANSMADAVGSKALSVKHAIILAAICEFSGAFLVGSHVTGTIRKGIIDIDTFKDQPALAAAVTPGNAITPLENTPPVESTASATHEIDTELPPISEKAQMLACGLAAALLASALWLNLASMIGAPVSTTHSVVGSVAGFGLLSGGVGMIQWGTMVQIVASWFISPVAGAFIAFLTFKLITVFILGRPQPLKAALVGVPVCTFFTLFVTSMATIYKGLNNINLDLSLGGAVLVSSGIGFIAAVLMSIYLHRKWHNCDEMSSDKQLAQVEKPFVLLVIITSCSVAFSHGANDVANAIGPLAGIVSIVQTHVVEDNVVVAPWLLAFGGFGIVLGLATFGRQVMHVVGSKITEISPSRGVAADIGTTLTVLTCSRLGLPISTTHTLVGAIIGVGLARGITAVNLKTISSIFTSWLLTLPMVALLTMVVFYPLRWILGF